MKLFKFICLAVCLAAIASCASAPIIKTQVTHPPVANMSGIKTITVVPLELKYSPDSVEKKLVNVLWSSLGANYSQDKFATAKVLTTEFARYIQAAGPYTFVIYSDRLLNSEPPKVDAFVTGEITDLIVNDDRDNATERRNNRDVKVTYYTRSVKLVVAYIIMRSSDSAVLFQETRYYTQTSDRAESKLFLPSVQKLAAIAASRIASNIKNAITPWTSFETYTLEIDKSKNPKMETAKNLVENRMFDKALAIYADVYNATGNPAAGYNAAILLDLSGDTQQAIQIMNELLNSVTDSSFQKRIIAQIARMQDEQQQPQN